MEAASQCSTRSEFKSKYPTARKHAIANGWMDEIITTYFPEKASSGKQNRVYTVYAYEFSEENSVYVGLTFNLEFRKKKHETSITDELAVFCKKNAISLPEIKIIEDNITSNAIKKHCEYYEQYLLAGWNILSRDPVENIPNFVIITRERAYDAAKQCTSLSDFRSCFYVEYRHAKKNNWESDYTWFKRPVVKIDRAPKLWDKEHTTEEAKKYKTVSEFARNCDAGYRNAKKYGWIEEYTWFEKKVTNWTKEMVIEISKKYTTLNDFRNNEPRAYGAAKKNKWLTELTWLQRKETLTKEKAFEISKRFKTYSEFKTGEPSVYTISANRGWLKEITWLERVWPEYTREYCESVAREFVSTSQLKEQNPKVYKKCIDNNWILEFDWLDDDIKRMEEERIREKEEKERLKNEIILKQSTEDLEENSEDLSYDECYDEAERCSTMKKFAYTHPYHYYKAKKMNWLSDYVWLNSEYDESLLTFEHCKEEAEKYDDIESFRKKSPLEYRKAKQEKWLIEFDWSKGEKPKNYWTFERCCECAEKCAYRSDFRYRYPSAYNYAKKSGLYAAIVEKYFPKNMGYEYDEDFVYTIYAYEIESTHAAYVGVTHMPASRDLFHRNANYNKYKSRLIKYCESIGMNGIPEIKIIEDNIPPEQASEKEIYWYGRYKNEGWEMINLEEKLGLLGRQRKKWTYEEVRQCALMCSTNQEFRENYKEAYKVARKRKWLSEFTWIKLTKRDYTFGGTKIEWTFDKCLEFASKYKTVKEFRENEPNAYNAAKRYGWSTEIYEKCGLEYVGSAPPSKRKYTVYAYEIESTHAVYVGVTYMLGSRDYTHKNPTNEKNKDRLYKYCKMLGVEIPEVKVLEDGIAPENASQKESEWYYKYQNDGWDMINTEEKLGILGGRVALKWTHKKVTEVAKTCKTQIEFKTKYCSAYGMAVRKGWMDEFPWLEKGKYIPPTEPVKWTESECERVSQKCESVYDFYKKYNTAYKNSLKYGWLEKFVWLYDKEKEHPATYDENYDIAKKYTMMCDFRTKETTAYNRARRQGWLKDYTWLKRGDAAQTFEEVEATARKYSSMDDFYKNDAQTYKVARKNGWMDKFDWLKRKHRHSWTFETAAKEAAKYASPSELFHKDRYLYDSSKRHGWLDMFVFSEKLDE